MNGILERIEQGKGVLTEEEREALEAYAESTGAPRKIYQVYNDNGVDDEDYLGTAKVGPEHPTEEAAIDWGRKRAESDESFKYWSVFSAKRCCTRKRVVWYAQASSYVYSSW